MLGWLSSVIPPFLGGMDDFRGPQRMIAFL
jgi:hypothetical protein